nr:unnamed protein product [Digitaria exilis]
MTLPALPAMPRKLIDRSMDPPRRRPPWSGGGRVSGERRGTEGGREGTSGAAERINCRGEGAPREGSPPAPRGGGDRSGGGGGKWGRLAWLGGDGAGPGRYSGSL